MPKKKLSPDELVALESQQRRLLRTIEFLESVEPSPSGPEIRSVIVQTAMDGDQRGMRLIERDVREMLVILSPEQRERLEAILNA